jgi:hypothetical protein
VTVSEHPLPGTLAEWLDAWQVAQSGNPWLKLGADINVVLPDRYRRGRWKAMAGRTFSRQSWPDPEAAKVGVYELLITLTPEQVHRLHAGTARTKWS